MKDLDFQSDPYLLFIITLLDDTNYAFLFSDFNYQLDSSLKSSDDNDIVKRQTENNCQCKDGLPGPKGPPGSKGAQGKRGKKGGCY